MKVAAYQASLESSRSEDRLALIREQVVRCEILGVEILCCPEGVLGGLADYVDRPAAIAIDFDGGGLDETVQVLASDSVTTILGFTEVDQSGRLFNAAAILSRGSVVGVYRKLHPAINRSVYHAHGVPVVRADVAGPDRHLGLIRVLRNRGPSGQRPCRWPAAERGFVGGGH